MYRALLLLAVAGCLLTGCVERRTALHLWFDEQADVLHILHVHTHILGHDKAERDWLVKQWHWRDKMIPTIRILGYTAYLRQSSDSYQQIDLDSPSATELPTFKTDLPLGDIIIRPGNYFSGPDGALAYTHQIDLPGKTLDALLQRGIDATREEWKKGIDVERERRKNGGKVFSWEECRETLLQSVESWGTDGPPVAVADDQRATPERCLSDESLTKLDGALKSKRLLQREGSQLSLSLPLTETDRGQLVSIYGEVHERALAKFKAKEVPKDVQALIDDAFLDFVRDIIVKPGTDDLLIVSCRLPRSLSVPAHEIDMPPSADDQALQKDTLAAVKSAGVPVRSDVKIDEVVSRFRSGE